MSSGPAFGDVPRRRPGDDPLLLSSPERAARLRGRATGRPGSTSRSGGWAATTPPPPGGPWSPSATGCAGAASSPRWPRRSTPTGWPDASPSCAANRRRGWTRSGTPPSPASARAAKRSSPTALREILIGDAVGRVTPRAGRTPLQAEFYATAQAPAPADPGRPEADPGPPAGAGGGGPVRLPPPPDHGRHPLRPRAGRRPRLRRPGGPGRTAAAARAGAGEVGALLVADDRCGAGRAQRLGRQPGRGLRAPCWPPTWPGAGRVDEGRDVLLRLALCDLHGPFPAALARCEALAADSASFPALARAAFRLDGLLAYGAARRLPVEPLGRSGRAPLRPGRAAPPARRRLRRRGGRGDRADAQAAGRAGPAPPPGIAEPELFWETSPRSQPGPSANPALRGLCLTLLELGGRLESGELARRLRFDARPGERRRRQRQADRRGLLPPPGHAGPQPGGRRRGDGVPAGLEVERL